MEEASKFIIGKVGIAVVSSIGGALLSFIISSSVFYEKVNKLEERAKEISAKMDRNNGEILARLEQYRDKVDKARFDDMQNTTNAVATLNGRVIALEVNQNNFIKALPKR